MVDERRRTHEPSIFAIGDVVGELYRLKGRISLDG
jgi:pyruvate/2-oxoglutarate dehydrogenase complex dihydrolipoamide dehydrogenase (E3) component